MTDKETQDLQERIACFADQHAFRVLFSYFYFPLFQFAVSIVKHREPAEEIVEDVFIRIWDNRESLQEIGNLRAYLYVSVRHRCLNHVTRKGTFDNYDLDQLDVACAELVPSPEDLMVASELLQRVNRAIQELPPKCRIVYKLVKEDGLTYREAGEILDISPRTVENHIAAAIRNIAAALNVTFPLTQRTLPASPTKS